MWSGCRLSCLSSWENSTGKGRQVLGEGPLGRNGGVEVDQLIWRYSANRGYRLGVLWPGYTATGK